MISVNTPTHSGAILDAIEKLLFWWIHATYLFISVKALGLNSQLDNPVDWFASYISAKNKHNKETKNVRSLYPWVVQKNNKHIITTVIGRAFKIASSDPVSEFQLYDHHFKGVHTIGFLKWRQI